MLDTRGEEVNWSLDQLVSVPSLRSRSLIEIAERSLFCEAAGL